MAYLASKEGLPDIIQQHTDQTIDPTISEQSQSTSCKKDADSDKRQANKHNHCFRCRTVSLTGAAESTKEISEHGGWFLPGSVFLDFQFLNFFNFCGF